MLGLYQIFALSVIAVTMAAPSNKYPTIAEEQATVDADKDGATADQFNHAYETSNGVAAQESGALRPAHPASNEGISVQSESGPGSFSGADGQPISITHEGGYQGNQGE